MSCLIWRVEQPIPGLMVEVKVERRSSGRLVSKRIILSDDEGEGEQEKPFETENVVDSRNRNCGNGNGKGNGKRNISIRGIKENDYNNNFMNDDDDDEEEFIPPARRRRPISNDEDEEDHVYVNDNKKNEKYDNDSQSESDSSSDYNKKNRNHRGRRLRESEKLISSSASITTPESTKRKHEKIKMEDEDAALAAAISAGYFSDDEREREREYSRLRSGTRFKDHLDNPTSTTAIRNYNPYARNGLGAYSGPMRRSGRTAAVLSAARVAMYSSMLNPDSSIHVEEPQPVNKYNLRPNRPGVNEDIPAYYEFNSERNTADTSNNNNNNTDRLFEEDDVDGHNNNNENTGEVSLAALDKIAGMDGYVKKLKEMIVFPLIYPHLFVKLNISLPRGVLFHGPPGTGKTLMARLLAAACSTSSRKVSFFMRNGSDCLSKWIGEAERNMRLLFKKAKECQPSIIFFDEIDGLAPERTGRQDQSHISLVSTLLALMDGLDDRGQVIVIGATNRIHSIDAALRRPGRFDREFFFGLPDESARAKILKIHTKTWEPTIEESLAMDLAGRTAGYSGADMKALCVEAALRAVQRTFPEVYEETSTPLVNSENGNGNINENEVLINVTSGDFEHALLHMTPSNRRHVSQYDLVSLQKPQSFLYSKQANDLRGSIIEPILKRNILLDASGKITWQLLEPLVLKVKFDGRIHPESLVWRFICGIGDGLDGFLVYPVDLLSLLDNQNDFESALWRGLNDARLKGGAFCVLFKSFDSLVGKENKKIFVRVLKRFVRGLLPGEPVIIIYPFKTLKPKITEPSVNRIVKQFVLSAPTDEQVNRYFDFVLKSIYRLISSMETKILMSSPSLSLRVSEEEFVQKFKLPVGLERCNVGQIERIRMEINDEASRDMKAFLLKYFEDEIFVEVRMIEEKEKEICEKGSIVEIESFKAVDDAGVVDNVGTERVFNTESETCDSPTCEDEDSYSYLNSLELPEEILFK